jgi:mannose-6-phosphate isomerase-like protein (cupin superfamily)
MRRAHLDFDRFFDVRLATDDAQAAEMTLEPGDLVVIEAGETHEIENDGDADLCTLNLYVPPDY